MLYGKFHNPKELVQVTIYQKEIFTKLPSTVAYHQLEDMKIFR